MVMAGLKHKYSKKTIIGDPNNDLQRFSGIRTAYSSGNQKEGTEAGMWSYGIQLLLKQKTVQHSKHVQISQNGKQSWEEPLTKQETITLHTAYINNLDNLFRSSDNIMYPTSDCSLISAII